MIGKTILHYKILSKLGQGGMGVVYKAQDTDLKRDVAIKFLPRQIAASEEERARFKIEAQAAAALNHANIATIYSIEKTDDETFIVMEYIKGQELKNKIDAGPLPIGDTINIAIQIAQGLQIAHEAGVVHRDIKSSNIMLTERDDVKIMDFGLAKRGGQTKLTKEGTTLGTIAYMSPEQARGKPVDHRSDIWSFGVVLYEMLTGQLPFQAEYEQAVIYSICNEEPLDMASLAPNAPPALTSIIHRCLEKDPDSRYQHFNEIATDLNRLKKKDGHALSQFETSISSAEHLATSASWIHASKKILIGFGTIITITVLALWRLWQPSTLGINPNIEISELQIPAMEYYYPGISSDGKWLTFPGKDVNGNWDIYMMFIDSGETRRLTTDSTRTLATASTAQFSPDGSSIAYSRLSPETNIAEVCVVTVLTNFVRVVADTGVSPRWSPVGDRLFYVRLDGGGPYPPRSQGHEYWSVSPKGTDAKIEFVDSLRIGGSASRFFSLSPSPDGEKLAFTRPLGANFNEIFIRNLTSGEEKQLTYDQKIIDEAVWLDNGFILYTSNRNGNFNIWAIPENGGEATQVSGGVGRDSGVSFASGVNRLIFSQRSSTSTLWMANTDGSNHRQIFPDKNILEAHIAPDGKTFALRLSHPTLMPTLVIRDMESGQQEILFPSDSTIGRDDPHWSPSGRSLAFYEYGGSTEITTKILHLTDGRQIQDIGEGLLFSWLSDSVGLVLRNSSPDEDRPRYTARRLLNIHTGEEKVFFRDTVPAMPVLDNTSIAFVIDNDIRLLSAKEYERSPNAKGKFVLSLDDMKSGRFADDSIFYISKQTGDLWKVDLQTLKSSKILDLHPNAGLGFFASQGSVDFSKFIIYPHRGTETKILKIDNLFVER